FALSGAGYAPHGTVAVKDGPDDGAEVTLSERPDLAGGATTMTFCNDARIVPAQDAADDDGWRLVGEPTEGALRSMGMKAGVETHDWARVAVVPFESEHKLMATLDRDPAGGLHVHVKGAPDRVLVRCATQTGADGAPEPLDRGFWTEQIDTLGGQGLRVLAAARATAGVGTTALELSDVDEDLEL